jgi:SAM-dependent methyltransferase
VSDVSRFWEALAGEHQRQLEDHGYSQIKRRQAFKYFTWSWRWRALPRSEQFRFLLRHSSPGLLLRAGLEPMSLSDAGWSDAPLGRADRWLYCFATRLLWEFTRTQDTAGILDLPEPERGGPLHVRWQGRLISQDLANTALEVSAIQRALRGRRPVRILEIGAGYGRTAYGLLSVFPEASYTIVDIEPARSISEWYLHGLFPKQRVSFVDPDGLNALPPGHFSLALSISSLQEMTPDRVRKYLHSIDRLRPGAVYLKQWTRWHNRVDGVMMDFARYPIPARWRLLYAEPAPVQTRFTQAAWSADLA